MHRSAPSLAPHRGSEASHHDLLGTVPDIPRWVETRAMLLSGRAEVLRGEDDTSSFVASSTESRLVSVVGRPTPEWIRRAVRHNRDAGVLLAQRDAVELVERALDGWRSEEAILHSLREGRSAVAASTDVRVLRADEARALAAMPCELERDLALAPPDAPVAVAFDAGRAAAFCYSVAETESLWDISIDTLEPYRNRGHATACAASLIECMAQRGKGPVWGALESNTASLCVAAKLGLDPVDRIAVFTPIGRK